MTQMTQVFALRRDFPTLRTACHDAMWLAVSGQWSVVKDKSCGNRDGQARAALTV